MVVIIDDRESKLFEEWVEAKGIEAQAFDNGTEAIEWLMENEADLILLDLAMPRRSGFEIAEEIRHLGIRTPILFITGYLQDIDKAIAPAFDGRVTQKPTSSEGFAEFLRIVREYLNA